MLTGGGFPVNDRSRPLFMSLSLGQNRISWALQLLVAGILFQTLFFKFTGAAESVYIFTTLGVEPYGRIGSGLVELLTVVLLLTPRSVFFGAGLSLGISLGAIASHLTRLGFVVQDDGGLLFGLALTVSVGSLGILTIRRCQIPVLRYLIARYPDHAQPRHQGSDHARHL